MHTYSHEPCEYCCSPPQVSTVVPPPVAIRRRHFLSPPLSLPVLGPLLLCLVWAYLAFISGVLFFWRPPQQTQRRERQGRANSSSALAPKDINHPYRPLRALQEAAAWDRSGEGRGKCGLWTGGGRRRCSSAIKKQGARREREVRRSLHGFHGFGDIYLLCCIHSCKLFRVCPRGVGAHALLCQQQCTAVVPKGPRCFFLSFSTLAL